jgi:hypothetical protein
MACSCCGLVWPLAVYDLGWQWLSTHVLAWPWSGIYVTCADHEQAWPWAGVDMDRAGMAMGWEVSGFFRTLGWYSRGLVYLRALLASSGHGLCGQGLAIICAGYGSACLWAPLPISYFGYDVLAMARFESGMVWPWGGPPLWDPCGTPL